MSAKLGAGDTDTLTITLNVADGVAAISNAVSNDADSATERYILGRVKLNIPTTSTRGAYPIYICEILYKESGGSYASNGEQMIMRMEGGVTTAEVIQSPQFMLEPGDLKVKLVNYMGITAPSGITAELIRWNIADVA